MDPNPERYSVENPVDNDMLSRKHAVHIKNYLKDVNSKPRKRSGPHHNLMITLQEIIDNHDQEYHRRLKRGQDVEHGL